MPYFTGHRERASWRAERERWLRVTIYRTMRTRRVSLFFVFTCWREERESELRHNLQANEKLVYFLTECKASFQRSTNGIKRVMLG